MFLLTKSEWIAQRKSDIKFLQGVPASLFAGKPSVFIQYKATQHNPLHFSQSILRVDAKSVYLLSLLFLMANSSPKDYLINSYTCGQARNIRRLSTI